MSSAFDFRPGTVTHETYADGTSVPHLQVEVYRTDDGGIPLHIGYVECHLHRRSGPDGIPDTSFGYTAVVFGRAAGGS